MIAECESTEPRGYPALPRGFSLAEYWPARTQQGMTDHQARQPKGTPTGGQFAATARLEAELTLSPETRHASAADVMATRSEYSQLIFVHYDDRLSNEQMDSILGGDWDGAEDDVLERFEDHAYARAREEAEELINAAYEAGTLDRELDELDEDEVTEAVEEIRENDTSDPITDLLRVTPDQLMRTRSGRRWIGWRTRPRRGAPTSIPEVPKPAGTPSWGC